MFFRLEKPGFLLTKYVMALEETEIQGIYFFLNASIQIKINVLNLVRTVSPTHTEVRVLLVGVPPL
jgi:hypothetical protein